jgi:hypothetical protein
MTPFFSKGWLSIYLRGRAPKLSSTPKKAENTGQVEVLGNRKDENERCAVAVGSRLAIKVEGPMIERLGLNFGEHRNFEDAIFSR